MTSSHVTNAILFVIAISLVAIAVRLWFFAPPTRADILAVRAIQNEEQQQAEAAKLRERMPLVWVAGSAN